MYAEEVEEPEATTMEEGSTLELPSVGEPVVDCSLTEEEPTMECPTLGHELPPDSQEDWMEVHTPEDEIDDW